MTDHYAEAEQYLELARKFENADDVRFHLMGAQVHATLATVQRPEPSQDGHSRTIPWPPSDELVGKVATAIAEYADESDFDLSAVVMDVARAVLDAIGGGA